MEASMEKATLLLRWGKVFLIAFILFQILVSNGLLNFACAGKLGSHQYRTDAPLCPCPCY
jgi:hypothetical protein